MKYGNGQLLIDPTNSHVENPSNKPSRKKKNNQIVSLSIEK